MLGRIGAIAPENYEEYSIPQRREGGHPPVRRQPLSFKVHTVRPRSTFIPLVGLLSPPLSLYLYMYLRLFLSLLLFLSLSLPLSLPLSVCLSVYLSSLFDQAARGYFAGVTNWAER